MSKINKVKILILAGGKGKRMQSDLPKVLAPLKGKPMIKHLLESIEKANINDIDNNTGIIVGHKKELVIEELGDKYEYIVQNEQLGTGHAVMCANESCKNADHILVLQGDMPLISENTVKNLVDKHLKENAKITFATTTLPDFEDWKKSFLSFGRILRKDGKVAGIKEYRDANDEEKNIKEVNAGCYVFDAQWLWKNLEEIKNENSQKEYYITDLFHIAAKNNEKIETVEINPREALGANSKEELEILEGFSI
ncbi:MAG: NTP transferase domain-containing protein [Patescibacteria group bacterium]